MYLGVPPQLPSYRERHGGSYASSAYLDLAGYAVGRSCPPGLPCPAGGHKETDGWPCHLMPAYVPYQLPTLSEKANPDERCDSEPRSTAGRKATLDKPGNVPRCGAATIIGRGQIRKPWPYRKVALPSRLLKDLDEMRTRGWEYASR